MSITLLVENNPKMIEIYQINLATYVGLEILVAKSKAEAVALMEKQAFDLVVCRAKIGAEDVASGLKEVMAAKSISTPLFVIPKGLDLKAVVKGAASSLGITAQQMVQKKVEDFFPVSSRYFEWINYPASNIFKKSDSGEMQSLCPALQKIEAAQWKDHEFLYVSKLDRLKMVNQITAELVGRLDEKDLSPDESIQAGASNLELLTQKLMSIGVNEETIGLAQKNIASLRKNVKTYPKLGQLLQRMLANQAGYLYRHTQIVTYISLHIVRNIDWGTPEQEDKIAFISFFHDIALENDKQGQIHSKEELRSAQLDTREKALVEKHAQLAAELVHKYPHAPMGADQIIRQHHGMLNGVGFSDHFGANLSPMAIVFVVAEEFTRIIIRKDPGPFDAKDLIHELREAFPTSRFQKIIDLLETIHI